MPSVKVRQADAAENEIYSPEAVKAYNRRSVLANSKLAEWAVKYLPERTPYFKAIEVYIATGTKFVRFFVDPDKGKDWILQLKAEVAAALGTPNVDIFLGETPIESQPNPITAIRASPRYALKATGRGDSALGYPRGNDKLVPTNPGASDPRSDAWFTLPVASNNTRSTATGNNSSGATSTPPSAEEQMEKLHSNHDGKMDELDRFEEQFAKNISHTILGYMGDHHIRRRHRYRLFNDPNLMVRFVAETLKNPITYDSSDPSAYQQFMKRQGVDISELCNDVALKIGMCACNGSFGNGGHKRKNRRGAGVGYKYVSKQLAEISNNKLPQAFISASLFDGIRNKWNRAFALKSTDAKISPIGCAYHTAQVKLPNIQGKFDLEHHYSPHVPEQYAVGYSEEGESPRYGANDKSDPVNMSFREDRKQVEHEIMAPHGEDSESSDWEYNKYTQPGGSLHNAHLRWAGDMDSAADDDYSSSGSDGEQGPYDRLPGVIKPKTYSVPVEDGAQSGFSMFESRPVGDEYLEDATGNDQDDSSEFEVGTSNVGAEYGASSVIPGSMAKTAHLPTFTMIAKSMGAEDGDYNNEDYEGSNSDISSSYNNGSGYGDDDDDDDIPPTPVGQEIQFTPLQQQRSPFPDTPQGIPIGKSIGGLSSAPTPDTLRIGEYIIPPTPEGLPIGEFLGSIPSAVPVGSSYSETQCASHVPPTPTLLQDPRLRTYGEGAYTGQTPGSPLAMPFKVAEEVAELLKYQSEKNRIGNSVDTSTATEEDDDDDDINENSDSKGISSDYSSDADSVTTDEDMPESIPLSSIDAETFAKAGEKVDKKVEAARRKAIRLQEAARKKAERLALAKANAEKAAAKKYADLKKRGGKVTKSVKDARTAAADVARGAKLQARKLQEKGAQKREADKQRRASASASESESEQSEEPVDSTDDGEEEEAPELLPSKKTTKQAPPAPPSRKGRPALKNVNHDLQESDASSDNTDSIDEDETDTGVSGDSEESSSDDLPAPKAIPIQHGIHKKSKLPESSSESEEEEEDSASSTSSNGKKSSRKTKGTGHRKSLPKLVPIVSEKRDENPPKLDKYKSKNSKRVTTEDKDLERLLSPFSPTKGGATSPAIPIKSPAFSKIQALIGSEQHHHGVSAIDEISRDGSNFMRIFDKHQSDNFDYDPNERYAIFVPHNKAFTPGASKTVESWETGPAKKFINQYVAVSSQNANSDHSLEYKTRGGFIFKLGSSSDKKPVMIGADSTHYDVLKTATHPNASNIIYVLHTALHNKMQKDQSSQ